MRRGQTVVEYMLVLSAVSLVIFAVMFVFNNTIVENVTNLSDDMTQGGDSTLINAGMQQN